jgi:AAA15 family ATPase/GTPase
MLKSWYVENFKSIKNSGWVELAPVTIFSGQNSSGKSSFLQSILMIAQTLKNPDNKKIVILNGYNVQLGKIPDIFFNANLNSTLKIGFKIRETSEGFPTPAESVEINFMFKCGVKEEQLVLEESNLQAYFQYYVEKTNNKDGFISFSYIPKEADFEIFITDQWEDPYFKVNHTNLEFNDIKNLSNEKLEVTDFLVLSTIRHFFPNELILHYYLTDKTINLDEMPDYESNYEFHFDPISEGNLTTFKKSTQSLSEVAEKITTKPNLALDLINFETLNFFTNKVRYLGPLRLDPNIVIQNFAPSGDYDDVGLKGEYSATVFEMNREKPIRYFNPISNKFEWSAFKLALFTWTHYLGIPDLPIVKEVGSNSYSWRIYNTLTDSSLPLSAVGVGVSQLLPVLVMGLLAPEGATLIFEQPELHLHPAVQARLGDFFVGLSKCGKQCLIETHSENLVNQLRLHMVEADEEEKKNYQIYFVSKDPEKGSIFEPVQISAKGNILNWPEGFFDETMHQIDRIRTASIKKRASANNHG